jgi:hypothetical protein
MEKHFPQCGLSVRALAECHPFITLSSSDGIAGEQQCCYRADLRLASHQALFNKFQSEILQLFLHFLETFFFEILQNVWTSGKYL